MEQELLSGVKKRKDERRRKFGLQTEQELLLKDHCGKGDQSSSSEEELMETQPFQISKDKESEERIKDQELNQENSQMQDKRSTSLSSIQIIDEYIAEHNLEITHAISLKENLGKLDAGPSNCQV
ncbi:hypothetical protein HNY73_015618 [Argiope bruennichi]|uniref:Uncharacterized protein n=1 Tax=Argiope bruennichi TaxID=94029 RepID=A0A8T0EUL8_ARGBR|nr:hypothetical protein HNY73_015618 [Argiope bruennichi]